MSKRLGVEHQPVFYFILFLNQPHLTTFSDFFFRAFFLRGSSWSPNGANLWEKRKSAEMCKNPTWMLRTHLFLWIIFSLSRHSWSWIVWDTAFFCFVEPIPFLFTWIGIMECDVFLDKSQALYIQHWTYPLVLTVGQNPPKLLKTETLGIRLLFPSQEVCFFLQWFFL